jgi:protease-4
MSEEEHNAGNVRRPKNGEPWAEDLIARLAFANLIERRRARRWGIFFKFLIFSYLLGLLLLIYLPADWGFNSVLRNGHTALVSVEGLIANSTSASADRVISGLRAAFKDDQTAGVIVQINSPGGSPVQAGLIYDEIKRLREAHPDIPLYAVAADVCASGGYYVAAAAQKIFANKASIIGSIGVRADSFGFVEAINKLGIERRLYTAGENKAILDPFTAVDPEDVQYLKALLDEVHHQFIEAVREGRGKRLSDHQDIFTGLFWTGEKSVALGLIDGLASTRYVAEEVIGARRIVDYTERARVLDRFFEVVESSLQWIASRMFGPEGIYLL